MLVALGFMIVTLFFDIKVQNFTAEIIKPDMLKINILTLSNSIGFYHMELVSILYYVPDKIHFLEFYVN